MAKVKDFGDRVRDRLKALGYVKNGRLDINGFSIDHGYIPSAMSTAGRRGRSRGARH